MVAVCVAEIAVLHRKTQVRGRGLSRSWNTPPCPYYCNCNYTLQLVKQLEEKDGYGKGVKNLLIKGDNFLPVFMAAV